MLRLVHTYKKTRKTENQFYFSFKTSFARKTANLGGSLPTPVEEGSDLTRGWGLTWAVEINRTRGKVLDPTSIHFGIGLII